MVRSVRRAVFASALALGVLVVASTADPAFADNSRAITSLDLATLRDLRSLSASPDGAWAAFQVAQADPSANAYVVSWHVIGTANAREALEVADAGGLGPFTQGVLSRDFGLLEPAPPAIWSPDSAWISYLRWDGERAQIWRTRRQGGAAEQLTHGELNVRRFVYSPDGERILYETEPSLAQIRTALAGEGRGGFLFDDRFYAAFDRVPVLRPSTALADGTTTRRLQASPNPIWTYDLARQRERPASETERQEFATLTAPPRANDAQRIMAGSAISPDGGLAWTEARDPLRQGVEPPQTILAQRDSQNIPVLCRATQCVNQTIRQLWWRNGEELIFLRAEGPQRMESGLYAWRVGDGSVRTILQTQGRLLGHLGSTGDAQSSCVIAADRLVCFYEEWMRPRRLVAIDLDSGAIETLYEPNPDFARFELGPPPQRLEFRTNSGETYTGVLILPPHHRRPGERLALVILTYSCTGFLRGGIGDEYPAYPMAAEGFAVLCLQLADDQERQASLDLLSYEKWYWGPTAPGRRMFLDSLEAAIKYLDEAQIIDPDRVGITGLSRGAQLVAWALTGLPGLSAASASGATGFGGTTSYYMLPEYMRDSMSDVYGLGSPLDTPDRWHAFSLSANAENVRAPLLINVADHELMEALEPVVALRDRGRAVEMFVYPDEYHWKWQPAHRLAIYHRNIDWMNFWLRGVESGRTGDATQYDRWREMRVMQAKKSANVER